MLTPSSKISPFSMMMSPTLMPTRNSMRRPAGATALRAIISRLHTAQRTASTTLANSARRPSPVVLTMRPRCSAILGCLGMGVHRIVGRAVKGEGIYELYRQMAEAAASAASHNLLKPCPSPARRSGSRRGKSKAEPLPLPRRQERQAAPTELTGDRGTDGSNPSPSSGESTNNQSGPRQRAFVELEPMSEPASLTLLVVSLAGLAALRRCRIP